MPDGRGWLQVVRQPIRLGRLIQRKEQTRCSTSRLCPPAAKYIQPPWARRPRHPTAMLSVSCPSPAHSFPSTGAAAGWSESRARNIACDVIQWSSPEKNKREAVW